MLEQYLDSPREKIIYHFGISLRYVIVSLLLWSLVLGSLSYFFQQHTEPLFLQRAPLVILILIGFFYLAQFLSTVYFVSDQKVYKKVKFAEVLSVRHSDISEMKIVQNEVEKTLFGTGKLCFIPREKNQAELVFSFVDNPYDKKKEIYEAWQK